MMMTATQNTVHTNRHTPSVHISWQVSHRHTEEIMTVHGLMWIKCKVMWLEQKKNNGLNACTKCGCNFNGFSLEPFVFFFFCCWFFETSLHIYLRIKSDCQQNAKLEVERGTWSKWVKRKCNVILLNHTCESWWNVKFNNRRMWWRRKFSIWLFKSFIIISIDLTKDGKCEQMNRAVHVVKILFVAHFCFCLTLQFFRPLINFKSLLFLSHKHFSPFLVAGERRHIVNLTSFWHSLIGIEPNGNWM